MDAIKQLKLQTAVRVGIILALAAPFAFFLKDPKSFWIGLLFGGGVAYLNFLELSKTLEHAVTMSPSQAQIFVFVKYMIRFLLVAVVIYISVRAQYIHVLGTAVGLLSVKASILLDHVVQHFRRKQSPEI